MVRSRLCCAPRQSTVGGGAHLDQVELGKVIEFGITVSEERTACRIVADRPVFVVKITGSIYHYGGAKCQSSVGRTADKHVHNRRYRILNAQPGDYPNIMFGVEGNRSVTGTSI